jgi:hypothetical protein
MKPDGGENGSTSKYIPKVREGGLLKLDECLLEPKCNEALH